MPPLAAELLDDPVPLTLSAAASNPPALRILEPAVSQAAVRSADAASALERAKAAERLEFVRTCETFRLAEGVGFQTATAMAAARFAENVRAIDPTSLNYSNARRWLSRLPTRHGSKDFSDIIPLLDNYQRVSRKSDKGGGEFWENFWALYCHQNKLSAADCHRNAAIMVRRGMSGEKIPTMRQVLYAIAQEDQAALMLARHGEEAVKNKYLDYIRRDISALEPNELWIADNRTFDMLVQIPGADGAPVATRPVVCAIIDAKSKEMVGWRVDAIANNAISIAETIAAAIAMAGAPPPDFLADNGKDFKCHGLSLPCEVAGHSHSIFKELGMQAHFSIPYNGRAKTVERVFRDVATTFDKWFSSYLGNKPADRPDSAAYYHKHPETLHTMPQFAEAFEAYLQIRRNTPSDSLDGHTPAEVWATRQSGRGGEWTPDRLRAAFLWPVGTRKVDRGPCVRVDHVEYFSDDLWPHLGQKLLVKVDKLSGGESASVFHHDGKLVCECHTRAKVPFLAKTPADKEAIASNMRHQRHQLKHLHAHVATLAGPARLVQPLDVFSGDSLPGKVVAGESMRSVKGSSHTFRHYSLLTAAPSETSEASDKSDLSDKSDASDASDKSDKSGAERLAKFHAFICSKPATEPAPAQSEAQPAEHSAADAFKKFMSTSH